MDEPKADTIVYHLRNALGCTFVCREEDLDEASKDGSFGPRAKITGFLLMSEWQKNPDGAKWISTATRRN